METTYNLQHRHKKATLAKGVARTTAQPSQTTYISAQTLKIMRHFHDNKPRMLAFDDAVGDNGSFLLT
jgi:hypothetical protein